MSLFFASNNFIFVHVQKTGGNSISSTLMQSVDKNKLSFKTYKKYNLPPPHSKHQGIYIYYKNMPKELFEKQRIVTSLRSPAYRLLSWYFYTLRKKNDKAIGMDKKTPSSNKAWGRIRHFIITANRNKRNYITHPYHLIKSYRIKHFDIELFKKQINEIPPQSNFFKIDNKFHMPDFIIDFNNLETSAKETFKALGINIKKLTVKNPSAPKKLYDRILKEYDVADIVKNSPHAEDYERFTQLGWKI